MAKGRKTGGRQAGTLNRATAEIKAWAQSMGPATQQRAIELLASEDENIVLKTIIAIWNRAYGMPSQHISGLEGMAAFSGLKIVLGDRGEVKEITAGPAADEQPAIGKGTKS